MLPIEEKTWSVLEKYFSRDDSLIHHHVTSWNNFITFGIEHILTSERPIVVENENYIYTITFDNVYTSKPYVFEENRKKRDITPMETRRRDLTYESSIFCNITEKRIDKKSGEEMTKKHIRVLIASIPVMLRSNLCHLSTMTEKERCETGECQWDKGGYFIIKGKERVLISQLRNIYNVPFVTIQKTEDKWKAILKIRSMSTETGHSSVFKIFFGVDNRTILVQMPYIKELIPLGLLYKALGMTENQINELFHNVINIDNDIKKYVSYIIRDSKKTDTTEDALIMIGENATNHQKIKNIKDFTKQLLENELFPHMGVLCSSVEIAHFITYITKKLLLTVTSHRKEDDLDDYKNKRIESAGILCFELFRQFFKKYCSSITKIIETKENPDIISIISRNNFITNGFRTCYSTGQWGVPKNNYIRSGVSQILSRLSFGATISSLRRINIPIGKEAKNTKLRQIHGSQAMFICPADTPEGHQVGIVLNMTLMTRISERYSHILIKELLNKIPEFIQTTKYELIVYPVYIIVNGIIIGYVLTKDAHKIVQTIRNCRQKNIIPYDVSITYNEAENEIIIYSDEGRIIRPLYTLDQNHNNEELILKHNDTTDDWDELIEKGAITYLDNNEIQNEVIAMYPEELKKPYKNTYCEISPVLMFGILASTIPFPQNSQAPRNCYYTSQSKQAMSLYSQSYQLRTDTITHVLQYLQKPIVNTKTAKFLGFQDMPSGINVIAAIMCYEGWNQEDSIIVKKGAVDRGLFTSTSYRTHTIEEKKHSIFIEDVICIPPIENRKCDVNYGLLDDNGIVRQRDKNGNAIKVNKGDVIVGRINIVTTKSGDKTIEENSIILKKGEEGFIDRIITSITPQGYRLVKVIIRNEKIPEVGDKLCSREAQKGTIGHIISDQDMPFTSDGISPDIIINPHAIPSRMTINQLLESVLSKSCMIEGKEGDATPFLSTTMDISRKIAQRLGMNGYSADGTEMMYNGMSGEPMGKVFIGPVYYHRLKHLVSDKIHARAQGPVSTLTKQPCEGRSREGGLRMGEMELSACAVSGATKFLKERLFNHSDHFTVPICNKCGIMTNSKSYCKLCNDTNIDVVNMPYASKLLLQQLNTMLIKTKYKVKY